MERVVDDLKPTKGAKESEKSKRLMAQMPLYWGVRRQADRIKEVLDMAS
jgi:hypothetical protein